MADTASGKVFVGFRISAGRDYRGVEAYRSGFIVETLDCQGQPFSVEVFDNVIFERPLLPLVHHVVLHAGPVSENLPFRNLHRLLLYLVSRADYSAPLKTERDGLHKSAPAAAGFAALVIVVSAS